MKALIPIFSVFALMVAITSSASAQSWKPGDAKIADVAVEIQQTPQFQTGNVKDDAQRFHISGTSRVLSQVDAQLASALTDRVAVQRSRSISRLYLTITVRSVSALKPARSSSSLNTTNRPAPARCSSEMLLKDSN